MSRWYCRITFPGSFRPSSSIESRQCYLESYQSAESVNPNRIPGVSPAFSPFDPFDPSSYSLSSLILAIRILVNLGYLGGYIIGRVESLRETFSPRAEVSRLSIEGSRRGEYISYIYTRQFLVNSF